MAYSFDFTGGSLPAGASVSRASNGSRVNASGVIESIGSNLPRFDYDPISLGTRGLLVEAVATNLLLYSEQFDHNAPWAGASTVTANAVVAPDGNTTADLLVPFASVANHDIGQSVTIVATTYTLSVFAKPSGYNWILLNYYDGVTDRRASFNVSSGAIGTILGGVIANIQGVGNGWLRCSITFTGVVGYNQVGICPCPADNGRTNMGNGTSGVYCWGAQLETGATPSTYIVTTTAAVSRAAETLSLNWSTQSIADGACFQRVTFDDLSTQLLASNIASGVATIGGAMLTRPRVRRIDYILSPFPPTRRSLTLFDNFA